VSKLRENDKLVIGVGVKSSTSDLLIANCDEFIFYDDLVRDSEKPSRRKRRSGKKAASKKKGAKAEANGSSKEGTGDAAAGDAAAAREAADADDRQQEALELVLATVEDLFRERGEEDKVWGSMVKQALKRRKPGFNESYHGYRSFGQLLEDARERGLLTLQHDEKSGGYIIEAYSTDD
jgi:hypothetical protein